MQRVMGLIMEGKVTDKLTTDVIQSWPEGSLVAIKAGTGKGKSHWAKSILNNYAYEHGQKILYLISRTIPVDEFFKEMQCKESPSAIDFRTYQSIEKSDHADLNKYKYIVCDEFHYFLDDATFNETTDISLDTVLATKAIKLFMSATGDEILEYLVGKEFNVVKYKWQSNCDHIKSIHFYQSDDYLEEFVQNVLKTNDKAIMFINNAKKAYALYAQHRDHCMFLCSDNNKEYSGKVDQQKKSDMINNNRFDDRILITTACLDSGFNLKDRSVKYVLCDILDPNTLIQSIGRRRIEDDGDQIFLFVKSFSNRELNGFVKAYSNKLIRPDYLRTHTTREYINKYKRQDDGEIIYKSSVDDDRLELKINQMRYTKYKLMISKMKEMMDKGPWGYVAYLKDKVFGDVKCFMFEYEKKRERDERITYLESIIGDWLFKDDQKQLALAMGVKDKRGRLQKSLEALNVYFVDSKLPYVIRSDRDRRRKLDDNSINTGYDKTYWIVHRLTQ